MRLVSIYLYVSDMNVESTFWRAILQNEPETSSEKWTEFTIGNARVGLLLDDESLESVSSTSVLVLEVEDKEIDQCIERAQVAGGRIVMQGLSSRIIMASPSGHQFELVIPGPAQSAA